MVSGGVKRTFSVGTMVFGRQYFTVLHISGCVEVIQCQPWRISCMLCQCTIDNIRIHSSHERFGGIGPFDLSRHGSSYCDAYKLSQTLIFTNSVSFLPCLVYRCIINDES